MHNQITQPCGCPPERHEPFCDVQRYADEMRATHLIHLADRLADATSDFMCDYSEGPPEHLRKAIRAYREARA